MKLLALVAIFILMGATAHADYVIAFHGPGCLPCAHMAPIEKQLRAEHYDVRTVELTNKPDDPGRPLQAYYKIDRWPQYCYVIERGGKSYDSGARLLGEKTAGQLRRFCIAPVVTATGAAVRGAVGAVLKPIVKVVQP